MSTYRPGGFQILPPVIKNLLIINVIVFFATYVLKKLQIIDLEVYLALFHWESPFFRPWQLLTHMFMHGDIGHLFFNMFALWMFGNVIENVLGEKKFIIFYLVCGIGAAACYLGVFTWENREFFHEFNKLTEQDQLTTGIRMIQANYGSPISSPMLGASGAVYGVLFAFGYLFPNLMIYLYFLFPIKAKYFVAGYALIELFMGISNNPADNVAHFAHLGGMLFAFILLRSWQKNSRNTYY